MHKIMSICLFGICTLLFAQDNNTRQNALGWESGIAYRRYLNDKLWIGLTLGGTVNDSRGRDVMPSTSVNDTDLLYSGTIKAAVGRELMRIHAVGLDAFLSGGYTYSTAKTIRYGTKHKRPSYTVTGAVGLEPKIRIGNRIIIGTQFGVQYQYQWYSYSYTSSNTYQNSSQTYSYSQSRGNYRAQQNVNLFGGFSLRSGLNVYFLF